ncbi:unnamed protein product, partial [Prorocentrum cordatum]
HPEQPRGAASPRSRPLCLARTRARPWAAQWRRLRAQHGALLARVAVLVAGEAAVEGWRSARRSGPTTSRPPQLRRGRDLAGGGLQQRAGAEKGSTHQRRRRTSTRSSTEYGGPDVGGVHPPATGAGSDGIDRRFKDGARKITDLRTSMFMLLDSSRARCCTVRLSSCCILPSPRAGLGTRPQPTGRRCGAPRPSGKACSTHCLGPYGGERNGLKPWPAHRPCTPAGGL